jgi:Tyrosine-protein kinase ephrin type A/B receptor-like
MLGWRQRSDMVASGGGSGMRTTAVEERLSAGRVDLGAGRGGDPLRALQGPREGWWRMILGTGWRRVFVSLVCACAAVALAAPIPAAAAPRATLCRPGSWSATGVTPCAPASIGYYVATRGATSQTPCPAGTSTRTTGSTSASACHAARVTGRVTPIGAFSSGTRYGVGACPGSASPYYGCPGGVLVFTTDRSGHYSLTLPPGTYSIVGFALPPDESPVPADQPYVVEVLSAGQARTLNWTVTGVPARVAARVTGTVTPTGAFPSGTLGVIACPGTSPAHMACPGVIGASTTDASGHYSLALSPGTYSIAGLANYPSQQPATVPADQPAVVEVLSAGQARTLNWTVTPPAVVSGTVTPTGAFPSGTTYGAFACPGTSPANVACPGVIGAFTTDASGHYSLALPPGTYSIWAGAIYPSSPSVPVAADQQAVVEVLSTGQMLTLNWTVTPPAVVSGTVTPTGAFPSGTTYGVFACPGTSPANLGCPGKSTTSTTDASGDYSLVLPHGTYSIVGLANYPSSPPATVPADQPAVVEVLSTGQALTLNWTVAPPAVVSGTVTPTGAFPSGTTYGVIACQGGAPPRIGCPGQITVFTTDVSGDYSLVLPQGTYNVVGFALPGGSLTSTPVAADQQVVEVQSTGQTLTLNWTVTPPA